MLGRRNIKDTLAPTQLALDRSTPLAHNTVLVSVKGHHPSGLQTQIHGYYNSDGRHKGCPPSKAVCFGPWFVEPHSLRGVRCVATHVTARSCTPWKSRSIRALLRGYQDPFQPLATIYNGHYLYYIVIILYIFIYIYYNTLYLERASKVSCLSQLPSTAQRCL